MNTTLIPINKQKGTVLILIAAALFLLMGMAALAIDLSHVETNKTRIQNLEDALALSAAISLNNKEFSAATTPANDVEAYAESYAKTVTLPNFKSATGNGEITLAAADFTFTFALDWSTNSADWKSASDIDDARFVRVTMTNPMNVNTWFARLMGINSLPISGTAVAGASPIIPCSDVLPIVACAKNDNTDKVCSDGACFGYATNTAFCFKASPGPSSVGVCPEIPPEYTGLIDGNFGWMDVGTGADAIKSCAAGDPTCQNKFCNDYAANGTVSSQTGDIASIDPAFNTRFDIYPNGNGEYNNPTKYPPDRIVGGQATSTLEDNSTRTDGSTLDPAGPAVTIQPISETATPTNLYVDHYKPIIDAGTHTDATHTYRDKRRILSAPFIDCNSVTKSGGTFTVPASAVRGWGCIFITQPMPTTGSLTPIYAEIIDNSLDNCTAKGKDITNFNTGIYKVQLYKDPLFGGPS